MIAPAAVATELSQRVRGRAASVLGRVDAVAGGPARRHVIATLATLLALDSADKATIGAAATQLQHGLHIGKTQIGVLLAVSSLVGAVATIPAGVLVDRRRRTRVLAAAVVLWGGAMVASGAATGFVFMIVARLALGAVTAIAAPAVASLLGDYFPRRERARVYGMVLAGELVGAGFGFVVAGNLAQIDWRAPFFALAVPAAFVAWLIRRLPEPARGGASRLPVGAEEVRGADAIASGAADPYPADQVAASAESTVGARQSVREAGVEPHDDLVVTDDPSAWSLWRVVKYVLSVRTNVVLIVASALGYFFFAGVRGFAVEFAKRHYDIGQGTATVVTLILGLGTLAGVLIGGRVADRLLDRSHPSARVVVAGVAVLAACITFVPALTLTTLAAALPLLVLAGGFLGATSPPLDAARLDIMPGLLWGRAEAVRSVLRNTAEAVAPVLFGFLAEHVFGGRSGLRDTFLLMLVPLAAAAVLTLVIGRRTYPADVATAAASSDLGGRGAPSGENPTGVVAAGAGRRPDE